MTSPMIIVTFVGPRRRTCSRVKLLVETVDCSTIDDYYDTLFKPAPFFTRRPDKGKVRRLHALEETQQTHPAQADSQHPQCKEAKVP